MKLTLKMLTTEKGVQIIHVGNEFAPITANYKKAQRDINIATAKRFGVKDPAPIVDYYEAAVERWRPKSKDIGRNVDKFTNVLVDEVFSKIDPNKL